MTNNKNKISYKDVLTQELLNDILEYDKDTGKLTYKPRARKYFKNDNAYKTFAKLYEGKEAGSVTLDSYRELTILGFTVKAHRLIMKMVTGEWPICVDHINGRKSDNRWCNIRSCTHSDNNRNQRLQKRNKSGYPGVYWQSRINKTGTDTGYWRAQAVIRDADGNIGKKNLGNFKDLDEAINAKKEWDEANGYHPNHGRVI